MTLLKGMRLAAVALAIATTAAVSAAAQGGPLALGGDDVPAANQAAAIHYTASLKSQIPEVRLWTIAQIRACRMSDLTNELVAVLFNDADESVRYEAAAALLDLGGKEEMQAVTRAAKDPANPRMADLFRVRTSASEETVD